MVQVYECTLKGVTTPAAVRPRLPILEVPLSDIPQVLHAQICDLLDVPHALGNDWSALAGGEGLLLTFNPFQSYEAFVLTRYITENVIEVKNIKINRKVCFRKIDFKKVSLSFKAESKDVQIIVDIVSEFSSPQLIQQEYEGKQDDKFAWGLFVATNFHKKTN